MRRRRNNSADELPYDEWIPTHAVRFNEDGTVSLMGEGGDTVSNPSGERPVIHIYGEPGAWTYSLVLAHQGHAGWQTYSHHYDKAFRTVDAAEQHAREHIGSPGYGGEFGTVENWQDPIVEVHEGEEGYEGAGIYGGGPPSWARRMNGRRHTRR